MCVIEIPSYILLWAFTELDLYNKDDDHDDQALVANVITLNIVMIINIVGLGKNLELNREPTGTMILACLIVAIAADVPNRTAWVGDDDDDDNDDDDDDGRGGWWWW